jgi:CRP-like cAMP-binding protein
MSPTAQNRPLSVHLRGLPFLTSVGQDEITLSSGQREALLQIGLRTCLRPNRPIYSSGAPADWVFVVAEGVVKCFRDLSSGRRAVCAFLFARDLFGLAENGRYLNSARSVTAVTLYRLPLQQLAELLKQDGQLQFHFLSKITHELRESHRRALILGRRDAIGRMAMFIALMAGRSGAHDGRGPIVALPMTRTDMADFLSLSLEAVSRASAELERRGLVTFPDRHHVRILRSASFAGLVRAT